MAKSPKDDSTLGAETEFGSQSRSDAVTVGANDVGKMPSDVANDKRQEARDAAMQNIENHPLSFEERFVRLENLAKQYFGDHHFDADKPTPTVSLEAEREAARAAFKRSMDEIEQRAANEARQKAVGAVPPPAPVS